MNDLQPGESWQHPDADITVERVREPTLRDYYWAHYEPVRKPWQVVAKGIFHARRQRVRWWLHNLLFPDCDPYR